MSTQPQQQPSGHDPHSEDNTASEQVTSTASRQSEIDELDSLLEEIDSVLESNAEDFVKGFVQKGGQ